MNKLPFIAPQPMNENEMQEAKKLFMPCKHTNTRKITQRSIFYTDIVCADCGEFIKRIPVR